MFQSPGCVQIKFNSCLTQDQHCDSPTMQLAATTSSNPQAAGGTPHWLPATALKLIAELLPAADLASLRSLDRASRAAVNLAVMQGKVS